MIDTGYCSCYATAKIVCIVIFDYRVTQLTIALGLG